MKTTLHGNLHQLQIYPPKGLLVTEGGRVEVCRVRGVAIDQFINVEVSLDVNTGEVLLFSPDGFVGAYRMGDLVAAHVAGRRTAREQRQRLNSAMEEDSDVAQAH